MIVKLKGKKIKEKQKHQLDSAQTQWGKITQMNKRKDGKKEGKPCCSSAVKHANILSKNVNVETVSIFP